MLSRLKSISSGPLFLFAGTLAITTGAVLGWRWFVSPVVKRRKSDRNQEFADFIFEGQQKRMEINEEQ